MDQTAQWTTAAPLWNGLGTGRGDAARLARLQPAILRFASDSFMDEFVTILANGPERLAQLVAVNESWRNPAEPVLPPPPKGLPQFAHRLNRTGLASVTPANRAISTPAFTPPPSPVVPERLMLYQPAHQRFYLVTGCLVCPVPGMPDCVVNAGNSERAAFVVRRLRPKLKYGPDGKLIPLPDDPDPPDPVAWQNDWEEYALVTDAGKTVWQRQVYPDMPPDSEERVPLFPTTYQAPDGRKRRLFAGLVPVSRREAYLGAPLSDADSAIQTPTAGIDPRLALLLNDVIGPWNNLIDQAGGVHRVLDIVTQDNVTKEDHPNKPEKDALLQAVRNNIQLISWYTLVDFYDYLINYLSDVAKAISGKNPFLSDAEKKLIKELKNYSCSTIQDEISTGIPAGNTLSPSLFAALTQIAQLEAAHSDWKTKLDGITVGYDRTKPDSAWPTFLFPLADPALIVTTFDGTNDGENNLKNDIAAARLKEPGETRSCSGIQLLYDLVADALEKYPVPANTPPAPLAAQPVVDAGQAGWFVIRCLYECPNCGPLRPIRVSQPTVVFQMASFYEPRAPARPIRISLPVNTTPAGFRQFAKNTAFMVSDTLACQKERLGGLTLGDLVLSVLPWPFHKDLPVDNSACAANGATGIGLICSLSIPIITICALILLMIIVNLLNMIFHWLPYFVFCFPLPKLSAKKGKNS